MFTSRQLANLKRIRLCVVWVRPTLSISIHTFRSERVPSGTFIVVTLEWMPCRNSNIIIMLVLCTVDGRSIQGNKFSHVFFFFSSRLLCLLLVGSSPTLVVDGARSKCATTMHFASNSWHSCVSQPAPQSKTNTPGEVNSKKKYSWRTQKDAWRVRAPYSITYNCVYILYLLIKSFGHGASLFSVYSHMALCIVCVCCVCYAQSQNTPTNINNNLLKIRQPDYIWHLA